MSTKSCVKITDSPVSNNLTAIAWSALVQAMVVIDYILLKKERKK